MAVSFETKMHKRRVLIACRGLFHQVCLAGIEVGAKAILSAHRLHYRADIHLPGLEIRLSLSACVVRGFHAP